MYTRKASIASLEYSDTDTEYLFTFYSDNWAELVPLLSDPYAYMRKLPTAATTSRWIPRTNVDLSWKLDSPVTARIECGYNNTESILKLLNFRPNLIPQGYLTVAKGGNSLELSDTAWTPTMTLSDQFTIEVFKLQVGDEKGSFYAEFAYDTGMLTIAYFPPIPVPKQKFPWKFTTAVLCRVSEPAYHGTLHFDLDASSSRDSLSVLRAKFIVGHIENGQRTCDLLNADPSKLLLQSPVMASAAEQISPPKRGDRQPGGGPYIQFKMPVADDARPWAAYPTVFAESLSAQSCMPCTMTQVYSKDNLAYFLGSIASKCYK